MQNAQDTDDETSSLLRDAAAHFLSQAYSHEGLRRIDNQQAALNPKAWQQFAEQGWLGLRWPEALGGSGLGLHAGCALAHQLGRHLVAEPVLPCAFLPAVLAQHLAGAADAVNTINLPAWQGLAEGCIDANIRIAVAWQDHPQMLDGVAMPEVQATPDGLRLRARKHCVVAADLADVFLVTAQLDGQSALWQVPAGSGLSLQTHVTSDGGTVSTVDFDNVALPQQALLAHGAQVQRALELAMDETLLLLSAQLIGIADAAQDLTLEYLRTRQQFERHIGSFQSLQHAAVDVRLQTTLAKASHRNALQRHLSRPGETDARAAIAAAKARTSDAALLAGRFGVQAHGAMGFAAESDIGLYLKAALRLSAFLGNGAQQRQRHGALAGLHQGAE